MYVLKEEKINDEYGRQTKGQDIGDVLRRKGISITYTRQTNNEKILDILNNLIENVY